MNAKEIRGRLDGALSGLAGDAAPVRKLAFELHDQLKAARQKLAEKAKELESFRRHFDEMTTNSLKGLVENQSLRQKLAQRSAEVAALEARRPASGPRRPSAGRRPSRRSAGSWKGS
jgi:hypothetical protein